jgi:hypothetical protein
LFLTGATVCFTKVESEIRYWGGKKKHNSKEKVYIGAKLISVM